MTRTDVMASSRPQTAGAAPMTSGSSRVWSRISIVALVALALALVPAVAVAAEPTSGYGTTPTTTTKTNTSPSQGVEPSKEAEKPTTSTPASEPTTSTAPSSEKASTLPFTGFDLRWDIGFGLLLMIAGFSIVLLQRRHRRERGH
jgi:cytoskeletal protein RodZ